jgi:uncharacterized protein (UPF0332 family)
MPDYWAFSARASVANIRFARAWAVGQIGNPPAISKLNVDLVGRMTHCPALFRWHMGNIFTQKSEETWKEGSECLAKGQANMAANRIYYSVFQAIKGFAMATRGWDIHDSDNVHVKALNVVCGPEGGKGKGFRDKLTELRSLRIVADYYPEPVDIDDLKALVKDADAIRKFHIAKAG